MSARTEALTDHELHVVVDWFLHALDREGERRLMTELPYHYSKLTDTTPHDWPINLADEIHNAARRGYWRRWSDGDDKEGGKE